MTPVEEARLAAPGSDPRPATARRQRPVFSNSEQTPSWLWISADLASFPSSCSLPGHLLYKEKEKKRRERRDGKKNASERGQEHRIGEFFSSCPILFFLSEPLSIRSLSINRTPALSLISTCCACFCLLRFACPPATIDHIAPIESTPLSSMKKNLPQEYPSFYSNIYNDNDNENRSSPAKAASASPP